MKKLAYMEDRDTVRALSTYVKLMRAAESLTARVHRDLAGMQLTISQFGALEALYHLGPMSQVGIGKKILKTSGNMTLVIDNLEKRGLVRRTRSSEDRRYFTVYLTESGEELMREFFPGHARKITAEMKVLTPAEQQQLGRLCKKVGLGKEANDER